MPRPAKLELGDPFDNDGAFYLALERFGYDMSDGKKAVEAFQRRWRPHKIDGEIDGEVRAILFQLLLDRDRDRLDRGVPGGRAAASFLQGMPRKVRAPRNEGGG